MAAHKRRRRSYGACSTRRTKAEIDAIKAAITKVLRDDKPMTVRQVFYRLVVRGAIEKTEAEYQRTVIRLLTEMRLSGQVPFAWIRDESRRTITTRTYDDLADAVRDTAKFYRRSALRDAPVYVELWCEKEALSGLIWDVAKDYDVPVVVSKGMPSLTQLHISASWIASAARAGKRSYVYQFGDNDPSGVLIARTIERRLGELCSKYFCQMPYVERVALTPRQVVEFNLPTRPTKREGNMHARGFEGDSTELDALPPRVRCAVASSLTSGLAGSRRFGWPKRGNDSYWLLGPTSNGDRPPTMMMSNAADLEARRAELLRQAERLMDALDSRAKA